VNFATFERAIVAEFAYREARFTGSLDCMRAICYVLRNRVKAGWGDGSWLSIITQHPAMAGNDPRAQAMDYSDRLLQLIVRDVDDIYLGQDRFDDSVRDIVCTDDRKKPALYYCFPDNLRPWFVENIIRNSQDHAHIGNIGSLMLFR